MKKISLILSLGALLAFTACDNARDIDPVDRLDEELAFQSVSDLLQGVDGMLDEYDPEDVITFSSRFSDDCRIGVDNGGQAVLDINLQLDPGRGIVANIWNGRYRTIGRANLIIAAAENIVPAANEVDDYNFALGQCYVIRALSHLDLMALFAPDFQAGSLAVPYVTVVDAAGEPARNTVAEVVQFINDDLAAAGPLVAGNTDITRVTSDVITAIRSRMALYTGDLAGANTFSTQLINAYPLADQLQYFDMFRDSDPTGPADDVEVIWRFRRVQTDFFPGGMFSFGARGPFLEVSQELFNTLDADDIRQIIVVDQESASDFPDELRVGKYFGVPGFPLLNDIKAFRVSEQYLIRAEVQARNSDLPGAAATIKQIRDARYGSAQPLPSYANLQEAIEDILLERRKELAYEGHRYIDLRRTTDITGEFITREEALGDCGGVTPCSVPPSDPRTTVPIPVAEIAGNSNMVQNPGY